MGRFICLANGGRLHFEDPQIECLKIEDIAHALAHINRFTGHTWRAYSVAEHSIICAQKASPEAKLHALMHDAHEAYLGDVSGPLKALIGPVYKQLAEKLDYLIFERFGVEEYYEEVDLIDKRMLFTEGMSLLHDAAYGMNDWPILKDIMPYPDVDFSLTEHHPYVIREMFINSFIHYGGKV
jgi:hypothetical protein